ncbi:hypothetical protein HPC49_32630 [Pyxidicoccus fallax]|uniref:Lipoprotein n=1 Tax=Pyxidicoccus fallax TaxID=394095 RepID=A0A848L7E8_9BACT|nr:MXAN_6652 family MXYO-CTERM-anchored protein [Pyxidicoccus fallax]NMO14496.1 hypothetical protein [Pyxidicoccus fallax]NPC82957.1 hypothetical protein [Pyxidicoccus fallax]
MRSSLSSLKAAGVIAACLVSGSALATSAGQVGHSGKQANMTCMNSGCHTGGGAAPSVTIEGPDTLAPGATGSYKLVITGGPAVRGGFNVAVDNGTLTAGTGQRKQSEELTHSGPKAFTNGRVEFDFTLVAPASAGTINLFGAGNSADGKGTQDGDSSAMSKKTITVGSGGGGGGDDEGGCSATGGAPLLGAALMVLGARLRRRR